MPTEPLIWLTAAQLEEANGSVHRVESIIAKAIKSLRANDVVIDRERWLQHAYDMERAGAVQTCVAIVKNILDVGVEPEDRRRSWVDDAEKALQQGAVETAKAIFAFTLGVFPSRPDFGHVMQHGRNCGFARTKSRMILEPLKRPRRCYDRRWRRVRNRSLYGCCSSSSNSKKSGICREPVPPSTKRSRRTRRIPRFSAVSGFG